MTVQNRIWNLLMGVLLLITLSYFIPSVPRQRTISQTEWVRTEKHDPKNIKAASKLCQTSSIAVVEFLCRIFDFNNRIQVRFKACDVVEFPFLSRMFAP